MAKPPAKKTLPKGCEMCDSSKATKAELYLHAKCHMHAPLHAIFHMGQIRLQCYMPDCGRTIATYWVCTEEERHYLDTVKASLKRDS